MEMLVNVITCFLIICVANGHCSCNKSENTRIFSIHMPCDVKIGQNTQLKITQNVCSERNETQKTFSSTDAINAELIQLSSYYDVYDGYLDPHLNVTFKRQNTRFVISIEYTYSQEKWNACLEVNFNKSMDQKEESFTLVFNRMETLQITTMGTDGQDTYQQKISVWREEKENREANEWRRFVYADTTTKKNTHTIHIAAITEPEPKIYRLLKKNRNNQTEMLWYTYDTKEIIYEIPSSDENWYIVQESRRTYLKEIVVTTLSIFLVILCALIASLWYASKPKQRLLVVIYCQCDRHDVYAKAVQKLLNLLEKNCLLKFESASLDSSRPRSSGEDEILLNWRSKAEQFIVFIPFPNVADHDRSYECEAHQLCEKYSIPGRQIELNLHFESSYCSVIRSEWPKGSYRSYQLLEDLEQFIRYMHPFYFPSFLEPFIRSELWWPRIKNILDRNTFTNDHFREITDPKFQAQLNTASNHLQADPNLAINAFI